ncbi:GNAT family N-acetyltransferase [Flavobacterium crassostreae]|uniref:N-acetyltransferase domain-containing protein n=1 Tax=Flavobacterium crassostreae TaxID=1763534 RepID=A0A1B9EA27_9FLAO|nr:GNAT family N-acetyltransferase [Flavobacterium crassostreae]OCB78751.1 hypothetical protein LPBF_01795 [Flavobacterium crassostreae]
MLIRKAVLSDAPALATCLLLAMDTILYRFIGQENYAQAEAFLLQFITQKNNQYSYQNCWVIQTESGVVAAANVYDGAQLVALRAPIIAYLKRHYHYSGVMEAETQPGEWYVDSLGVRVEAQGNGLGSQLLRFLIQKHVVDQQQTLGLLVDKANPEAKKLYLKLGFRIIRPTVLAGKPMEHLQIGPDFINLASKLF